MMKQLLIIGLIVILASTQTTVTPKTQGCACINLLSQADCNAKSGCLWTFASTTNSSTNTTTISTIQGTCSNSTTTVLLTTPPTYCLNVTNVTMCASTPGCAFQNNTCTIFTGCSAYTQTTNGACQAISTQCTTDGIRCVTPTACSTYTSEALCSGNLATSGAKSCNWTASGSTGTCADKVCTDAPVTFTTQVQCTGWIVGCLASGKGCATTLAACSSYTQANGCSGMIGSDGPCTTNTAAGSTVCRPLACTDAATTLATNTACAAFLTGCVTTGKGCVSALSACSSYTQTQGCTGLIGSDGPCTANTTAGSTTCRALACTDAPASTNTNAGCVTFLAGCVTTGQGCTNSLGQCSSYTGTTTTCSSYIGSDGNCKGTSATAAACAARTCADAPTTTNTAQCTAYQTGCVTTGAGCTAILGSCTSYTGTNTTCTQFIGSDGNCTAPSTQTSAAACVAKLCTDAPNTTTTNSACQAFSYQCVTNGAGCIAPTTCEATPLAITCQGSSSCVSNQICLNRSQCANYLNQSQCSLNQQQYLSGGIVYLRACAWAAGTCSNTVCTTLSTSFATDAACNTGLAGCLTNGAGCLDISAPCTDYKGTQTQCNAFKGLNGTQTCSNTTAALSTANCIIKICAIANTGATIGSQANCISWLSGCVFDGKDNCTDGDCTSYYGTQTQCASITTAKSGSNPRTCWKIADISNAATQCIVKQCGQADNTLKTNAECNTFLTGCVTNGAGCVDPSTVCSAYAGSLASCNTFTQSGATCTKTAQFCQNSNCTQKTPPIGTANNKLWCQSLVDFAGNNCQYDTGPSCIASAISQCSKFIPTTGTTDGEKAFSCFQLKLDGTSKCGLAAAGTSCIAAVCTQFAIPTTATTPESKIAYCKQITTDSSAASNLCGLAIATSSTCSARACSDYGIGATNDATCEAYKSGCKYTVLGYCYLPGTLCTPYVIPPGLTTDLQKAQYCASTIVTGDSKKCSYRSGTSTTNCGNPAGACTDFGISSSLTNDLDKLAFCRAAKKDFGAECSYISTSAATCAELGGCITYSTVGATDDEKQLYCSKLIDDTSKACVFSVGTSCTVPSGTACSNITTSGTTATLKQAVCNAYTRTNKCGYAFGSSASTCTDAACADVATTVANLTFCSSYLSTCVYDGLNCVTKVAACSTYDAQIVGSGPVVNCANLTDTSGNKCTFVTGATKCAARACTDTITSPSADNCKAYLSTCIFNGSACIAQQTNCNLYSLQGNNDAAKAASCNVLSNSGSVKCTFITGGSTCVNTVAACDYTLPAASQNVALGQPACGLAQDPDGKPCAWNSATSTKCVARTCALAINDTDCNAWLSGCDLNLASFCSLVPCSNAPITATTNTACGTFRKGCVTNGGGCLESTAACSQYKGTQAICNGFTGNNVPCSNISTAITTDACQDKTCALNTTAQSDSECKNWLSTCVWKGTPGCTNPQPCASFTGTVDSCPTFTANDGPCYGTGTAATPVACAANNILCTAAPTTFSTDLQCKTWGSACMTNGFGCILASSATCQSISSHLACPLYKSTSGLFCDLANHCKQKPSTCGILSTPTECNNTPLAGSVQLTCAWNVVISTCIPLTCALLPVTLTSDSTCSAIISTCTTNGAGCITKASCSTYPKLACGPAATTDTQKVCIWANSVCRPIQCTDNMTATSDAACNTYLAGCRTTGTGCSSTLTCSSFTNAALCLFDSTNYPCLWYKSSATATGTCINYKQCTDIISSSHAACQAASPLCTTNGTSCIAITGCSRTVLQASCILGTDGNCGWLPAAGTTAAACALYTNCSAATGTTTAQCQAWGSTCISNGTACISRSTCSSYTTQTACGNTGTDGACFWVAPTGTATTGTCRLQLCSDATTNLTTHTGCVAFSASTACTTSETSCIPQATCSAYTVQAGCVQGTDGVCHWATTTTAATNTTAATTTSVCRLKQCTDSLLTSSSSCASAITGVKCVSNGVNCIPQSTCSSYIAREACLGGGSDGACAFTPGTNSTTPNVGTCALFTQCTNANSDQAACNTRSDACFFNSTTTNGTTTSSCSPHTCATRALGSSCQPVPSWDLSTYQICVLTGTTCAAGNPTSLTASTCYPYSVGTYSWSVNTSACTACISASTSNTTNNTANNTSNSYGYIIGILLSIALLI